MGNKAYLNSSALTQLSWWRDSVVGVLVQSGFSPGKWMFPHIPYGIGRCTTSGPLDTTWDITNLLVCCSPPRFPLPFQLFYHNLSTCWPFLWSCYSGWGVGWSQHVCFECVSDCVVGGLCVLMCVLFGEIEGGLGESMQDAFASAAREKVCLQ